MSRPIFSVFDETTQWCFKHWPQEQVHAFAIVDSTNLQAKNQALDNTTNPHVFVANQQTLGRGRGLNSWVNPAADTSLLISFSYPLTQTPQPITGAIFGLAIYRALRAAWPSLPFRVKAPNDIFLNDKKIAGILIEVVQQDFTHRLIVGLGLNVFSHPIEVETASHLEHFTTIRREDWWHFLDFLRTEMIFALKSCVQTELSLQVRNELLQALNTNLGKEIAYTSVSAKGDLYRGSQLISWRDL